MIDRRDFLISTALLAAASLTGPALAQPRRPDFTPILAGLGRRARLGVFAIDSGSGRTIGHDENSRFAMCSTFKLPLAAAILAEVEEGRMSLGEEIAFTRADLVNHSPRVEPALERGRLSVEQLCAAIVEVSDNAAANLLLARIGGPTGFTGFMRRCGDSVTRLDRTEPEMNRVQPGDLRDTTTPAAMAGLARALLTGEILTPASRTHLAGWMEAATTGRDRLRAGLPGAWRAGDKTGTAGSFNNDIAITWPPGRGPIVIASYIDAPTGDHVARNAAHAAVARLIATAFG